jgi:hypothetical protein
MKYSLFILLFLDILVHCLLFANVGGAIRFTMQLHNQILCLNGYLFKFGLHAIILIGSTLISIILAGLTDSLYNHKQIYKISFAMVAISSTILSWVCLIILTIAFISYRLIHTTQNRPLF